MNSLNHDSRRPGDDVRGPGTRYEGDRAGRPLLDTIGWVATDLPGLHGKQAWTRRGLERSVCERAVNPSNFQDAGSNPAPAICKGMIENWWLGCQQKNPSSFSFMGVSHGDATAGSSAGYCVVGTGSVSYGVNLPHRPGSKRFFARTGVRPQDDKQGATDRLKPSGVQIPTHPHHDTHPPSLFFWGCLN